MWSLWCLPLLEFWRRWTRLIGAIAPPRSTLAGSLSPSGTWDWRRTCRGTTWVQQVPLRPSQPCRLPGFPSLPLIQSQTCFITENICMADQAATTAPSPTTSTAATTTAPAPTPAGTPERGTYTVSNGSGTVCLLAQMGLQLNVSYFSQSQNKVSGRCVKHARTNESKNNNNKNQQRFLHLKQTHLSFVRPSSRWWTWIQNWSTHRDHVKLPLLYWPWRRSKASWSTLHSLWWFFFPSS